MIGAFGRCPLDEERQQDLKKLFLKNTSNKKILKVIKFQGKSSSTRGIKTKKLPGLDRVKTYF